MVIFISRPPDNQWKRSEYFRRKSSHPVLQALFQHAKLPCARLPLCCSYNCSHLTKPLYQLPLTRHASWGGHMSVATRNQENGTKFRLKKLMTEKFDRMIHRAMKNYLFLQGLRVLFFRAPFYHFLVILECITIPSYLKKIQNGKRRGPTKYFWKLPFVGYLFFAVINVRPRCSYEYGSEPRATVD